MGGRDGWATGAIFDAHGVDGRSRAVLLSVPHAGRAYSDAVLARCRLPLGELRRLEDRHADLLITRLIERGYPAIVARTPRAVIDMNRDARDIDPRGVIGIPRGQPLLQTVKQRGGLGLFPRSLPRSGDLWRGPIFWDEALSRIEGAHEPYHRALDTQLDLMNAVHGEVLLVDVHSMPPLPASHGARRTDVVIGDRFGASASSRLAEAALGAVRAHGLKGALNHPYPGYYLVERHGWPVRGRHALQVEISRDLYLDQDLDHPGGGLEHIQAMLAHMVERLEQELNHSRWAEAAE